MLPYVDDILFDVKHMDSAIHRVFTGQGNELILSNLHRLAGLGAPLTIRVPLIPGFNASPQIVRAIAESVLELGDSLKGLDLLPYHTLGTTKYTALGREYAWEGHERLATEEIEGLAEIIRSYGMRVKVGG
jgi:pyruvate formate lyase activating enzyme